MNLDDAINNLKYFCIKCGKIFKTNALKNAHFKKMNKLNCSDIIDKDDFLEEELREIWKLVFSNLTSFFNFLIKTLHYTNLNVKIKNYLERKLDCKMFFIFFHF